MTGGRGLRRAGGIDARVERREDPRLLSGRGTYVGDIRVPGLLHLRLVRSTLAHARIGRVDAASALGVGGVVAVVTGRQVRALTPPLPVAATIPGLKVPAHHALAPLGIAHVDMPLWREKVWRAIERARAGSS